MPASASARTVCAAVMPDPQYAATAVPLKDGAKRDRNSLGGPQPAVGLDQIGVGHVDRARDVSGDRIDRLGLAAETGRLAGIDQHRRGGRVLGVQHPHVTWLRR